MTTNTHLWLGAQYEVWPLKFKFLYCTCIFFSFFLFLKISPCFLHNVACFFHRLTWRLGYVGTRDTRQSSVTENCTMAWHPKWFACSVLMYRLILLTLACVHYFEKHCLVSIDICMQQKFPWFTDWILFILAK